MTPNSKMPTSRRRRRMRGAGLIEYAFLAALVVVPLVEVTDYMQREQREQISESGNRAGLPVEYSSGVDTTGPPPTFDPGDDGSGDTGIETFASLSSSGKRKGQKWTAVAVIAASDVNGSVSGGVFEGYWEVFDVAGNLDRTINATCTIDTKGNCTLSLASLDFGTADKDVEAKFTITGLDSVDLVPAAGVIGSSISIDKFSL